MDEKEKKSKEVKNVQSSAPENVVQSEGINLIPVMTKEEIVKDEKKKKIKTSSLISISILFSVSILVTGFNIISKVRLNAQRDRLYEYESRMAQYDNILQGNDEIIQRISLYQDMQKGRFSTKEVIIYIQNILSKSGSSNLTDFSFSGSNSFVFSGEARDFEDVARLWYLLSNDSRTDGITLKSLSKGESSARYSFVGNLKLDQFSTFTPE